MILSIKIKSSYELFCYFFQDDIHEEVAREDNLGQIHCYIEHAQIKLSFFEI